MSTQNSYKEIAAMKTKLEDFCMRMQIILNEDGQDLVEYALVIALIALGATAAMSTLAGTISTAFGTIGTNLSTAT
jgi:pilus assembly protein Flp/PilA